MSRRASHKLASPSVVVIANALRERVLAGEYRDNGWLPTERELAEEFGVSRTIVRRAIEELERQGLVVRSPRCRPVVKRQATTVPSTEARRLTLGLWLWPSATFPGASAILRGIYKTLDANRWLPGSPFLTTANQPFERIGEWATRLLLQRIEQGDRGAYQHVLLEAPISIHASTRHARREAETYSFHSRRETS